MTTLPRYKAAACHAEPIYFNVAATVDKACALIAEAAGRRLTPADFRDAPFEETKNEPAAAMPRETL